MKSPIIFFFLFMLASAPTLAQGMSFSEGSWEEILVQAKAQKKPIFIDIYTTWCGPCKQMSKNIFPMEAVGKKYNALFINYKVDAEKGEGIALAKKYNVEAYPTYLFVDANENLFYRSLGSMPAEKFLAEADLAIAEWKSETPLAVWDKQYTGGKRDAAFLLAYLQKRTAMKMNSAEVLEEYVKTQSEDALSSDENLALLMQNIGSIQGKAFQILMKNKNKVVSYRGDRRFMLFQMRMSEIIGKEIEIAIKSKDKMLLDKCIEANEQVNDDVRSERTTERTNANIYMRYYRGVKDKDSYLKTAISYIERQVMTMPIENIKKMDSMLYERVIRRDRATPTDSAQEARFRQVQKITTNLNARMNVKELNNAAWGVIELFEDKAMLEMTVPWLDRALKLLREPFVLDTYAHLLFKLGKKQEAITLQKEAIEKAMQNGETSEEIAKYDAFLQELEK